MRPDFFIISSEFKHLHYIMFRRKRHYGEFNASEEKIASNILADRLKKLEANGMITKQRDSDNLSRLIYTITEKGLDLIPVIFSLIEWVDRYYDDPGMPEGFLKELKKDKNALEKKLETGSIQLYSDNRSKATGMI